MAEETDAGSRFEYRVWFAAPTAPRGLFAAFPEEEAEPARTDTYLLARGRPRLLPKLRDAERFEVKRLLSLTADGLERWDVIASVAFPLDAAAIEIVVDTFDARGWAGTGIDGRSPGRLLRSLEAASPIALAVEVAKRRKRFIDARLVGEVTDVSIPAHGVEAVTVAVESASEARLRSFLRETGLLELPNLGYGAFLLYLADTGVAPLSETPRHLQPSLPC